MMGVSEELCADPAIAVLRKNKKAEDQKTMTKSNNGLRKYGDRRKFCVIDVPRQYENLRLSQE